MIRKRCLQFCLQSRRLCSSVTWPKQIFSGIQPTGSVHLGNYLGAIKKWVELQDENEAVIYSIVDLHSITIPQERQQLQQNVLTMTATLLACGINPEKSILFQQSKVPQHTELCWILGTMATMSRLAHLPQYKEKSADKKEIPLGLFVYPILQAADILLYKTTDVPVGEDQVQQIQMAQQLTKTFNHRFGVTFPTPSAFISDDPARRLRSLRDPSKKMSKSDPDVKSKISLLDTDDEILDKCKKAVTDFTSQVTFEPDSRPGVANLLTIHASLTNKSPEEICNEVSNLDTGQYKLRMADEVISVLAPLRQRILEYLAEPQYLVQVLEHNRVRACAKAETTMMEVRDKVGLDLTSFLTVSKEKTLECN